MTFKPGKKMEEMVRNMDPVILTGEKLEDTTETAENTAGLESTPVIEPQAAEETSESFADPPDRSHLDTEPGL